MGEECAAMNDTLPHILIAEREFLIALDAEHLIKSALDCRISLLRPEQLADWSGEMLAKVDLCLLDVALDASKIRPEAERLIALGVPLLFTTVCEVHRGGVEGLEAIPVTMKPYDGDTLAAAVTSLLPPAGQPFDQAGL
jgi:hypothetical protein